VLAASRWKRVLTVANENVMALYLWHMVPVIVVTLVGYPLGLFPQPPIGSGTWWLARLEWLAVLSLVTSAELVVLWWKRAFFVAPLPMARSPLPIRWTEPILLTGTAAAAVALSRFAADGFAPDAKFPVVTSLLFAGGLALMALEGTRPRTTRLPAPSAVRHPSLGDG
jgi:hypothetical protein